MKLSIHMALFFLVIPLSLMANGDAEDKIIEKAESAVLEMYEPGTVRVEISSSWIPGSVRRLSEDQIKTVKPAGRIERYSGFRVSYLNNGVRDEAEIQLQVLVEMRVPVLMQRKQRGDKLTVEDLTWRWQYVDLNRQLPVTSKEKLLGSTLRRSLNSGDHILPNHIGSAFLVNAGDVITMHFRKNGIQINLNCESRQDGSMNEQISVYCKETRKKYLTKITAKGEVQWLQTQ